MKNKKNLYILLPAVLIIWGLVIYRFFTGINPTTKIENTVEELGEFKPKKLQEADTFSVDLNYRDPFLGTFPKKKKSAIKRKSPVKKEVQPETSFPSISYKGLVTPKGKNQKVFLISVNNQQHLYTIGSSFNEVKLLSGNDKEITLQFQKQKQTFQLQK